MPLTPTPGNAALAAGFTLVPGTGLASDLEEYINRLADEVAGKLMSVWGIPQGGTGATTAPAARANLGVNLGTANQATANLIPIYNALAQLTTSDPTLGGHAASKQYVDGRETSIRADAQAGIDGRVSKGGDSMSGQLFLPNSFAASSGWTVAYINSDGRVSRGASSERYKKFISPSDPAELGNIWPAFVRYQMRADGITPAENVWRYGYIAEALADDPDQAPFVVWREIDGENVPDSIDFIGLLMAQVAQLNQRLAALETAQEGP